MSLILLIAIAAILLICIIRFTQSQKDEPDYSGEYPKDAPKMPEESPDKDSAQHRDHYTCEYCDDKDCACHQKEHKGK